ncbi:MAG TPA: AI-2E family transporter, partial [Defluviitaleaceae bacterium]|nr:AI-2E family transporter [Defluviitaleaceae bacterium]
YVGLHPITVIFVLLTGGMFFGLTGLILAVPVAALIKLIMQSKK